MAGAMTHPSFSGRAFSRSTVPCPFRGNTIINNKVSGATEVTGGLHLVNPFLIPEVSNNTIQGNGGGSQLVCTPVGAEILLDGNTIPAGGIFGCRSPARR